MNDYTLIINAIRALGFTPITPPADMVGAIAMIPATDAPLDARLSAMADQFGMRWELNTSWVDRYGYWVLEV